MEPKIVNHGRAFGNENWYTFYCPKCSNILHWGEECPCGQDIEWKAKEDTE